MRGKEEREGRRCSGRKGGEKRRTIGEREERSGKKEIGEERKR